MAKNKKEKLKKQLDLATDIYKAFCDGGQLSQQNLSNDGVDNIGFIHNAIRDNLRNLIRELAYRFQIATAFSNEEKTDGPDGL